MCDIHSSRSEVTVVIAGTELIIGELDPLNGAPFLIK
jgi:hypothetical protein